MPPYPEDLDPPIRTIEGKPDPGSGCPGRWVELVEGDESFWVDSMKGRGSGRKTLDEPEEFVIVGMMGIKEEDELGLWWMKEEKLEIVDWMKLGMRLLKVWLWGSVVDAMETKEGIKKVGFCFIYMEGEDEGVDGIWKMLMHKKLEPRILHKVETS